MLRRISAVFAAIVLTALTTAAPAAASAKSPTPYGHIYCC